MSELKILSLDISTTSTGYSYFKDDKYLMSGAIAPKEKDWLERVILIAKTLKEQFPEGSIDKLIVENTFSGMNVGTLKKLCMAQGIIIGALLSDNVELIQVYPKSWQAHFSMGAFKRNELKKASIETSQKIIKKDKIKRDDESDAILIGLYYIEKVKDC